MNWTKETPTVEGAYAYIEPMVNEFGEESFWECEKLLFLWMDEGMMRADKDGQTYTYDVMLLSGSWLGPLPKAPRDAIKTTT